MKRNCVSVVSNWFPRNGKGNISLPFFFEGKLEHRRDIVIAIDAEITQLQQARNLLDDEKPHKRRTLSAETRAKIAAAQRRVGKNVGRRSKEGGTGTQVFITQTFKECLCGLLC